MSLDTLKELLNNKQYQISVNNVIISTSELFCNIKNNYLSQGIFANDGKYYKINSEQYTIDKTIYTIETFYDVTELIKTILYLKKENELLKKDGITGLSTRSELDNYLISLKKEAIIVICDIDDFKLVNDTWGHPKGDDILKKLGEIINKNIRKSDFAGRYGGEEFLIIFDINDVYLIKQKIDKINFEFANCGIIPNISFSAGISIFNQQKHIKQVIEEADKALYEAKNSGKNRCIIYNEQEFQIKKKVK